MKRKQPVLIIVAGIVCATIACFAVHRAISRRAPVKAQEETVNILVATRDIVFGELLVLKGEANRVNVALTAWPKRLLIKGAITDSTRIGAGLMRAYDDFVTNQPILDSQIVSESEFIPEDMVPEFVPLDQDEIRTGRWRPGMVVDVYRVSRNQTHPFLRSARIYAIGSLDPHGRPVKGDNPLPRVFLLVKKLEQKEALISARLVDRFVLAAADNPNLTGPMLVDSQSLDAPKRAEAQVLLKQAKDLVKQQKAEDALAVFNDVAQRYPDIADVADEARRGAAECRRTVALDFCDKAQSAAEKDRDFAAAMRWLGRVDVEFADVPDASQRAKQLRGTIQQALEKDRLDAQYRALLAEMDAAVASGDLPRASRLLSDAKQAVAAGVTSDQVPSPAEVLAGYEKRITETADQFERDKKLVESYLSKQSYDPARVMLKQMRQKYPSHPDLSPLEAKLPPEQSAAPPQQSAAPASAEAPAAVESEAVAPPAAAPNP